MGSQHLKPCLQPKGTISPALPSSESDDFHGHQGKYSSKHVRFSEDQKDDKASHLKRSYTVDGKCVPLWLNRSLKHIPEDRRVLQSRLDMDVFKPLPPIPGPNEPRHGSVTTINGDSMVGVTMTSDSLDMRVPRKSRDKPPSTAEELQEEEDDTADESTPTSTFSPFVLCASLTERVDDEECDITPTSSALSSYASLTKRDEEEKCNSDEDSDTPTSSPISPANVADRCGDHSTSYSFASFASRSSTVPCHPRMVFRGSRVLLAGSDAATEIGELRKPLEVARHTRRPCTISQCSDMPQSPRL
ncbi:uncharacterized protein LAESUDRAFT_758791 [Laetiporus sulphureus 93-53]|uniref:Uncharacterized protein n=1 Tax=Laetiporus sulphureus 93-53 TaxID=1314785 RepID=A0A165EFX7_9APHY|nr:uncharacterized protein LAESUDRAFT_758791 [Laetiporus sulphureus 93-53]KZT06976.1 hypothetical protein LAESUDRAFT_758791 [Laetiporus sulphureus 93-53]